MSSTANMYRVGDYVFFEINTASPFQIRRIEELNKTPSGNVEAKVMCFYRRRDIGQSLLKVIDGRSAPASQDAPSTNGTDAAAAAAVVPKVVDSTANETNAAEDLTTGDKLDTSVESDGGKMEIDESEQPEKPESAEDESKAMTELKEIPPPKDLPKAEDEISKPEPVVAVAVAAPVTVVESEMDAKVDEETITEKKEETEKIAVATVIAAESTTPPSPTTATIEEKTTTNSPTQPPSAPSLAGATSAGVAMPGEDQLTDAEKHRLLHRELFLSRQIETLPATHIRGKCTVTLLNELETPESYLNKDDAFFYSLVYDPAQKTILADKGEIRVGDKYQAEVPESMLTEEERKNDRAVSDEYESLIYQQNHGLTDRQLDQFLVVARAVGTLARAFDMNSATKYAGLHTTVAAASRDVTVFQAMVLLHQADYDIAKATSFLVPPAQKQWYPVDADKLAGHTTAMLGGPLMCRDQMEEWSAAESNLFEEALEKYGKDFNDIRQDFLPWKSLKDIVEYYYMWKTTDRYIQQKRVKAAEAESRLKQVYIPTYAKPNPNAIGANSAGFKKSCEGCAVETSDQWYAWGPVTAQLRLCKECWNYWKKYGGLKKKHKLENFDKLIAAQPQEAVQSMMMPRPGDRLVEMPDFGGRVQRCSLPGCSMQFANLQTLNQHLRRDHGLPWTGQDSSGGGGGGGGVTSLRTPIGFTPNAAAPASVPASGTPPLHHYAGLHAGPMRNGPRTRAPVFLRTTLFTKSARRLAPKQLHNPRHAARNPFEVINAQAIRTYCQAQPPQKIQKMARVLVKMGLASASAQASSFHGGGGGGGGQKSQQQAQQSSAAARSNQHLHGKQGHPNVATVAPIQRQQHVPQKRPAAGASAGGGGGQPPTKRVRELEAAAERGGDALFVKWINTPDDYYYHRTKKTKLLRRLLTISLMRRMGRQPYRMHASTAKVLAKHGMIVEPHLIKN